VEPRRTSILRITATIAVVAGITGIGALGVRRVVQRPPAASAPWSAPYVDVTLTPTYAFQDRTLDPALTTVLSFVVADPADTVAAGCTPSWGAAYGLDAAATGLDLDRRITQLRRGGGDVIVSFGGQANRELATTCTDVDALTAAYRTVIDRYHVTTVDFDLEGDALDPAASVRRAEAVARVQADVLDSGGALAVWLTLPVAPTGLLDTGLDAVAATLSGGVDLAGVNVMTMDYGAAKPEDQTMIAATEQALDATHGQLAGLYRQVGVNLSSASVWHKVGATPMIGQNDTADEQFTVADAHELRAFAERHGMARVSMWSLNRDAPCPDGAVSTAGHPLHSNACSGVDQVAGEFAAALGQLTGTADAAAGSVTRADTTPPVDDAATSPYPLWDVTAMYPAGAEVVRHGQVFQAKWFSQGQDPDVVAAHEWETPWALVGPVLTTDRPATVTTLAAGTHPEWVATDVYPKGTEVLFEGLPYRARWTTQGERPSASYPTPPDAAWTPTFAVPGAP
jgi:chitinase